MARPFEFDKTDVLNRAMSLFWDKGYFNTNSDDIAKKLGLSRSSIYNSFTDKRTLFIAALNHYIGKESKAMFEALNTLPPSVEGLRIILDSVVQQNLKGEKPKGCLVVNSVIEFSEHDVEIRQILQKNLNDVVKNFTAFLKKGQQQKQINRKLAAHDLAILFSSHITSIRVVGRVVVDPQYFTKQNSAFLKLFVYKRSKNYGKKGTNNSK